MQANVQSESAPVEVEAAATVENSYGQILLNSLILLCCESELSLHSLKSVIEVPTFMSVILLNLLSLSTN